MACKDLPQPVTLSWDRLVHSAVASILVFRLTKLRRTFYTAKRVRPMILVCNTHHTGAVLRNVVVLNRFRQGGSRRYASPTMAPRRPGGGRVRTAQERRPSAVERTGRHAPYARRADRPGHGEAPRRVGLPPVQHRRGRHPGEGGDG